MYKKIKTIHGTVEGRDASEWLIGKQLEAISSLKAARFVVKVNSMIVPGVNDHHIHFLKLQRELLTKSRIIEGN